MRKVLTFLYLFLASLNLSAQVDLKSGLIACYPFNGNTTDETGNGNNGTIYGAQLTTDRFGNPNKAYQFDGSSQYIEVSANQFKNNTYSFSIWAFPDETPSINTYTYPFSVGGFGGDQSLDLSNSANGATGWTFGGYLVGAPNVPFCHQGYIPSPSEWYHIVGVRSPTTMSLYVNGVLVMQASTGNFNPSYGNNSKVTIGCRSSLVQYFKGKVDDIHVYNRPLNENEIQALYKGSSNNSISINTSSTKLCNTDPIEFQALGGSPSSTYAWRVNNVLQNGNSNKFTYSPNKFTGAHNIDISLTVSEEQACFPTKDLQVQKTFSINDCTTPVNNTQVDLKNGLIACYPFNGNTTDETGNGNNGTIYGAQLTTDRFGNPNKAYQFDGSSQYIEVSANQFKNNTYSFSIWAFPDETPSINTYTYPFSVGGFGGDQSLDLSNSANGATGWTFGGYLVGAPNVPFCHQGYIPSPSEWYHIVGVRSPTTMSLYVNGVLVMQASTGNFNPSYGNNSKVTIGCRSSLVQYFKGKVDDIHVYNRPLNENEIQALYKGSSNNSISINTSSTKLCNTDPIEFQALGGSPSSTYTWRVNNVLQNGNSNKFTYSPNKSTGAHNIDISLTVSEEQACFPTKDLQVQKTFSINDCTTPVNNRSDNLLIPTAFTPNSDGINDTWLILGTQANDEITIEIYNRWGELVFASEKYDNQWNGTSNNGKELPIGVYAYKIKHNNHVYQGGLLITR